MRNMLSRRQYIPYQEYYKKIIIGLIKILEFYYKVDEQSKWFLDVWSFWSYFIYVF